MHMHAHLCSVGWGGVLGGYVLESLRHLLILLQRVVFFVLHDVFLHLLHLLLKHWGKLIIHIIEQLLWARPLPWFRLRKCLHHLIENFVYNIYI